MLNVLFSVTPAPEPNTASSLANGFSFAEFWKNSKLNVVTTLYIAGLMICFLFITVVLLIGQDTILRPIDIRIMMYTVIVPFPLIICYYLFSDWAAKKSARNRR